MAHAIRHLCTLFVICNIFLLAYPFSSARADMAVAARHFDEPETVGTARYSYLFWDVYDAQLVAPRGDYRPAGPLKLTLTYLRDIKGRSIVERTLDELRRQGEADGPRLADWAASLDGIIPDVTPGDSISGVRDEVGRTHFYVNGRAAGTVDDPDFGRSFFDIWLGPESRDGAFTARLTGKGEE